MTKTIKIHKVRKSPNDPSSPTAADDGVNKSESVVLPESPDKPSEAAVRCSAWLGSWSESSIDKLLHEPNQNPVHELEYGSLQPIGKFQPDLEIQNDGHGRFVQVPQCTEAHKAEQSHPTPQKEQSHRNDFCVNEGVCPI
ncbi:MAG: hypothetical protein AABY22_08205 [Nanoarchaeota archaeon]